MAVWGNGLGGAAFSLANRLGRDKNVAPPSLAATCFRKPPYDVFEADASQMDEFVKYYWIDLFGFNG